MTYKHSILALAVALISQNSFGLECSGTEPKWKATLDRDVAVIDSPLKQTKTKIVDIAGVAGYPQEFLQIYSNKSGALAIINRTDHCTDGVNKRVYPYEVVFVGDQKLYGCCGDPLKE